MQSALKLSGLLLCLSLAFAGGPSPAPAVAERVLLAGCPADAIVCPAPKPAAEETPAPPKKVKKGVKG